MKSYIIIQIIILIISTLMVTSFFFITTKPVFVMKNKKLDTSKVILYSTGISLLFTLIITIISIKVDKNLIKNKLYDNINVGET